MASQSDGLYAGLSDAARETCIRRMARTLSSKPRNRKTREYVNSLTGESETEAQLRARAMAAATKVIERAAAGKGPPIILRARKSRLSPFVRSTEKRHPTKHCRRASRHQPHFVAESPRGYRDMAETARARRLLHEAQGGRCAICGCPLDPEPSKGSIDHVIPHALGGRHGLGNYVLTHGECNGDKTNDAPTGCEMVYLLMVNAKLGVLPVVY